MGHTKQNVKDEVDAAVIAVLKDRAVLGRPYANYDDLHNAIKCLAASNRALGLKEWVGFHESDIDSLLKPSIMRLAASKVIGSRWLEHYE